MNTFDKLWEKLMIYGSRLGCHQLPERSFFFHGYQFPVCARCTGIILGYILGVILYPWINTALFISVIITIPLAIDGITQYLEWRESNSVLRITTGIACGFGIVNIEIWLILKIYAMII